MRMLDQLHNSVPDRTNVVPAEAESPQEWATRVGQEHDTWHRADGGGGEPPAAPVMYTVLPTFGAADIAVAVTITGAGSVPGVVVVADDVTEFPGTIVGTTVRANLNLPAGRHVMKFRNPDGQESNTANWDAGPPVLMEINPETVSLAAGTFTMTVSGRCFKPGAYVYIGAQSYSAGSGSIGFASTGPIDPATHGVGTHDVYVSYDGLNSNTLPMTITA